MIFKNSSYETFVNFTDICLTATDLVLGNAHFEGSSQVTLLCSLAILFLGQKTQSVLDCTFTSSTSTFCRWRDDFRDRVARWRVLYFDQWTGESACVGRVQSQKAASDIPAVAKLWSPWVQPGSRCFHFSYQLDGPGRLSVLRHSDG